MATSTPPDFITKHFQPLAIEFLRLLPEGLVVSSAFFALVTLSYPLAIFFGTMVETTFILRFLQTVFSYLSILPAGSPVRSSKCSTGFSSPTLSSLSIFGSTPLRGGSLPSSPLFMITTAASYLFTTLSNQSLELQALGPAYSTRYYFSMILLMSLVFVIAAFRISSGCDTFGVVIITIGLAIILGMLLVTQNKRLFGEQSVNLLGIPLLRNRTAEGKPIYVCPN